MWYFKQEKEVTSVSNVCHVCYVRMTLYMCIQNSQRYGSQRYVYKLKNLQHVHREIETAGCMSPREDPCQTLQETLVMQAAAYCSMCRVINTSSIILYKVELYCIWNLYCVCTCLLAVHIV